MSAPEVQGRRLVMAGRMDKSKTKEALARDNVQLEQEVRLLNIRVDAMEDRMNLMFEMLKTQGDSIRLQGESLDIMSDARAPKAMKRRRASTKVAH